MDADTGKGDFTAAAQGRFIQGGTCAGAAGAGTAQETSRDSAGAARSQIVGG